MTREALANFRREPDFTAFPSAAENCPNYATCAPPLPAAPFIPRSKPGGSSGANLGRNVVALYTYT
jgi:hypothetical protein